MAVYLLPILRWPDAVSRGFRKVCSDTSKADAKPSSPPITLFHSGGSKVSTEFDARKTEITATLMPRTLLVLSRRAAALKYLRFMVRALSRRLAIDSTIRGMVFLGRRRPAPAAGTARIRPPGPVWRNANTGPWWR